MASSSLDDVMDPLFGNDWLQEHNLDVLFDLFEEEIEQKDFVDGTTNNSSSIFGTSPITSYLFSTSPSLASALDLYDWLYYENQQPMSTTSSSTSQQQQPQQPSNNNSSDGNSTTLTCNVSSRDDSNQLANKSSTNGISKQSATDSNAISNQKIDMSVTDVMRIKRKFKRGQSEGISLLARPLTSSGINKNNQMNGSTNGNRNFSSMKNNTNNNFNSNEINKSNSDNISTKSTNSKKFLGKTGCSGPVSIDRSRQATKYPLSARLHHHHHHYHHLHYITGCAIIREHAYAVQGH